MLGIVAILMGMTLQFVIILTAVLLLRAYFAAMESRDRIGISDVSSLVKSFNLHYSRLNSIIKAIERAAIDNKKFGAELHRYVSAYRLNSKYAPPKEDRTHAGEGLAPFLRICSGGILTGQSVSRPLRFYEKGLDAESTDMQRFESKIKGMQTISLFGVVFFLPMFIGISLTVIDFVSSFSSAAYLSLVFRSVSIIYTATMLFIAGAFRNPGASAIDVMGECLPMALVSALVFHVSSVYASSVI